MSTRSRRQGMGNRPGSPRGHRKPHRIAFEALEDRLMLDAAPGQPPPAIVVGRTLSTPTTATTSIPSPSYFVGEVQDNQVAITYTVYNEQADLETGVLLTTTLEPGLAIANASIPPDRNGQDLAWSLGTIQGYDRASVTLTVNLPGPTTMQFDTGAHAYATLDDGVVSASTPAATLRPGNVSDPASLASTPGANTTDPFIQEEAAKLGYDPAQIFDFLHTAIGYNSYVGSVRGARGTLWSSAGNALDVASLGVALMRASGIPARYVSGTLSQGQAQALILSMFPASYQTIGYVPAGTQTSDPADDPRLLSESDAHFWFQFDTGGGTTDADPLMPGATAGQAFTASTGTLDEVPAGLRARTEFKLTAETFSQAGAALGVGDGLSRSVVLDETMNDVDLVGRPVTFGNYVQSSAAGFILTAVTNTYAPYMEISDEAYPYPGYDRVITGTPYQEVLTNFPHGTQLLTGLFLDVTSEGPSGPSQDYTRTVFDRIGYAARQGLANVNLSADPSAATAIQPTDIITVSALPGLQSPEPLQRIYDSLARYGAAVAKLSPDNPDPTTTVPLTKDFLVLYNEYQLIQFLTTSGQEGADLAVGLHSAAYYDLPRITAYSERYNSTSKGVTFAMDLRRETMRVLPGPGQNPDAEQVFNVTIGLFDNAAEQDTIPHTPGSVITGTTAVFQQAAAQGIPLAVFGPANVSLVSTLPISADARAYITTAIQGGALVVVPSQEVTIDGAETISWYEINPTTGEVVGALDSGIHSTSALELVSNLILNKTVDDVIIGVIEIGLVGGTLIAVLGLLDWLDHHPPDTQSDSTQPSSTDQQPPPVDANPPGTDAGGGTPANTGESGQQGNEPAPNDNVPNTITNNGAGGGTGSGGNPGGGNPGGGPKGLPKETIKALVGLGGTQVASNLDHPTQFGMPAGDSSKYQAVAGWFNTAAITVTALSIIAKDPPVPSLLIDTPVP